MPQVCNNKAKIFLFVYDAKLFKILKNNRDAIDIQQVLHAVVNQSKILILRLNIIKCVVICIRRICDTFDEYYINNKNGDINIENETQTKDLGIIMANN